jgi:DNA polymerase (family X)
LLATIRGDSAEAAVFSEASALVGSRHIEGDADLGPLVENPPAGIAAEVITRLRYMFEAGGWVLLESAIADLPSDLRWLFELEAVTIEQLAALHQALGVTSAADLRAAVIGRAVREVPGLDAVVEAAIDAALPSLRKAMPLIPLGRATALAHPILSVLRQVPGVRWAEPVGSLRRAEDMVGDIEIFAPTHDPAPRSRLFSSFPTSRGASTGGPGASIC